VKMVLDASVTLAWVFPEETTPAIEALFAGVLDDFAWIPGLWRIEVANALSQAVRQGRIDRAKRTKALTDLACMPILEDSECGKHVWHETVALADKHRLTVYDATYLELALRLSLPLATLDEDLRKASQRESVSLLGK
jgi:predicted nucleic acid-binding protein